MKTLNDFIGNTLREHANLVASGIESTQALNIVSSPLECRNIEECLSVLTVDQLDDLVLALRESVFQLKDKKSTYYISGIVKGLLGFKIVLTDNVLQIDNVELFIEELTKPMKEELLKGIRRVL